MIYKRVIDSFPLIYDINEQYVVLREQGCTPEQARDRLMSDYVEELEDYDEKIVVLSGIALAQREYSELDETTKQRTLALLQENIAAEEEAERKRAFSDILRNLSKEPSGNKRIKPPSRKQYCLNWAIGDTFAHKLTHPIAENAGILGWYLLFRKVGQYTDYKGKEHQLGYVTLCPENLLPQSTAELNDLGFLRVMQAGKKWEYMVQLDVQSKRTENTLQLERIGCFPDAATPIDEVTSDPRVTMPFYDGIDKASNCPRYEDSCCLFYRWYGIGGK